MNPPDKSLQLTALLRAATELRRYYCGLHLEDYQELNHVDANSVFETGIDHV